MRRCSPAGTPLARGPGRRRGGSLESEDLPLAAKLVPLEEGGNVLHRLSVVLGGVLLAVVLAAPAFAVDVRIRVEGAKRTIFGPSERLVTPVSGTFRPPAGPNVTVTGATPFGALERGSRIGEFFYRVRSTSFGPYVDRIGRRAASGSNGWVFKVNHVSPPVGAGSVQLERGDHVLWYFATFGSSGGPRTLDLARVSRRCYRAFAYDDAGTRSRPRNISFVRDGRRVVRASGRFCPSGHWHRLRALKEGTVRSDVVRR
jgi:hypothetical protein